MIRFRLRVAKDCGTALASRAVEKTIMGLKNIQITAQMAITDLQKTHALLLNKGRTQ